MKEYINIQGSDFLKIKIGYELGGYSYFTGKVSKRGIYIYLQEVEKGNGWEKFTLLGKSNDYKILLKELKRQNNKDMEFYANIMRTNKDLIYKLWCENKGNEIKDLFKVV